MAPSPYNSSLAKKIKNIIIGCLVIALLVLAVIVVIKDRQNIAALKKNELKGIVSLITKRTNKSRLGVTTNEYFVTVTTHGVIDGRSSSRDYKLNAGNYGRELEVGDSIYKPADSDTCAQYKRNADSFIFHQTLNDMLVNMPL